MLRLHTIVAAVLLSGCFSDPAPSIGEGSTSAATTETGADGSSSGGSDPIAVCRACQNASCASYAEPCVGDSECDGCIDAPYSLACIASELFRPLGACSCNDCEVECGYMCPGDPGECRSCALAAECGDEISACLAVPENACSPCIEDAFQPGCAESTEYDAVQSCQCASCGSNCVWQCDGAGNDCADCLLGPCTESFNACLADDVCGACFANNSGSTCGDDELFAALAVCTCDMCAPTCGPLFHC